LKIQNIVLGDAHLIKIADSGRLSGYAKTLKGQSDYPGILQLWDVYVE
jgi:peptide/nickel transport system substrate-binding protein